MVFLTPTNGRTSGSLQTSRNRFLRFCNLKLWVRILRFWFRLSSLEDDLRQRLLLGMRDAQRDVFHAELLRDFFCFTSQLQCWPATFFAHDFQIHPAHAE